MNIVQSINGFWRIKMYNSRKKDEKGLTTQQIKCAEIEANNPMAGCKELAEMT